MSFSTHGLNKGKGSFMVVSKWVLELGHWVVTLLDLVSPNIILLVVFMISIAFYFLFPIGWEPSRRIGSGFVIVPSRRLLEASRIFSIVLSCFPEALHSKRAVFLPMTLIS